MFRSEASGAAMGSGPHSAARSRWRGWRLHTSRGADLPAITTTAPLIEWGSSCRWRCRP